MASFQRLLQGVVALLAPGGCRLCESRLLQAVEYPVCDRCLSQVRAMVPDLLCGICCEPLPPESITALQVREAQERVCAACAGSRPRFVRATAFGQYDELRPMIRLLKFEGVPSLAKPLGTMLAAAMLQLHDEAPAQMAVVPVPLFRRKRAYNQSTLLATHSLAVVRRAAPGWSLTLRPELLRRTRQTESQFLLSPAQRRDNLRGAFEARGAVKGLDVLLVDDVYTTGATAHECTRVLLGAGAASVRVATLARAGRDTAVVWRPAPPQVRVDSAEVASTTTKRWFQ